jgi:hypothetical protein
MLLQDTFMLFGNYILYIYLILAYVIIGVICAYYVYIDAKGKRIKGVSAKGWALVCLFLGILGLLIYLIAVRLKGTN